MTVSASGDHYHVYETVEQPPHFVVFKHTSDPNSYGESSVGVDLKDFKSALIWCCEDADEPWQ